MDKGLTLKSNCSATIWIRGTLTVNQDLHLGLNYDGFMEEIRDEFEIDYMIRHLVKCKCIFQLYHNYICYHILSGVRTMTWLITRLLNYILNVKTYH